MSRDRDAKRLAEAEGISYTAALRRVRAARERCGELAHDPGTACGPFCLRVAG